jgi:hypothetical protein
MKRLQCPPPLQKQLFQVLKISVRNPVRDILGMNNLHEFPTVILSL